VWEFYTENETMKEGLQRIIDNLHTKDVFCDYTDDIIYGPYEDMTGQYHGIYDYMS